MDPIDMVEVEPRPPVMVISISPISKMPGSVVLLAFMRVWIPFGIFTLFGPITFIASVMVLVPVKLPTLEALTVMLFIEIWLFAPEAVTFIDPGEGTMPKPVVPPVISLPTQIPTAAQAVGLAEVMLLGIGDAMLVLVLPINNVMLPESCCIMLLEFWKKIVPPFLCTFS